MKNFIAIDLFSGIGGLSEGLKQAGFEVKLAFEIDSLASEAYKLNHERTEVIVDDIRKVSTSTVKRKLKGKTLALLAGCPPCQGFSSIRRLNRMEPVDDDRNDLINEYVRFVEELKPYTIMMENVPGLRVSGDFSSAIRRLEKAGYYVDCDIMNVKNFGVPQNRRRLVLVGSRLGPIHVAPGTGERVTVRDTIGELPLPELSVDALHQRFPHHTARIMRLINDIPHDGGSRKDLGSDRQLKCHTDHPNVGFNDVYGRLRWDDYSTTITGGCLNPSKGRFLHPEQNRCISAREASLLQTFPPEYKFPLNVPICKLALMIGNALPPRFCQIQAINIKEHIIQNALQGS